MIQMQRRLIDEYAFIEPSVGAGALFFALVKKLLLLGVSPSQLQEMRVDMVDLNQKALDFVSLQVRRMEDRWGIKFDGLNLIREDFRNYQLRAKPSLPIFFGNPPFVTNDRGASRWKNLFADFVEISLRLGKGRGFLHYILPLSIAFSRDYRGLRYAFKALKMELSIASFDNIPDTLFKSGKPKHTNSNRANSQRCTILTAVPADEVRVSATKLHRWSRGERARILSSVPEFFDVTDYAFDDQFPRPASAFAAHYLSDSSISRRFSSLLSNASGPRLLVASVARNYIGFRDEVDSRLLFNRHVIERQCEQARQNHFAIYLSFLVTPTIAGRLLSARLGVQFLFESKRLKSISRHAIR